MRHTEPVTNLRSVEARADVTFECLCGQPIEETLKGGELDGCLTTEIYCDGCGAAVEFTASLDLWIEDRRR